MTLTIDIGNTNIVIGVFKNSKIKKLWRIKTDLRKSCDEYEMYLRSFFREEKISLRSIKKVGLSSVVPPVTAVFEMLLKNLVKVNPCVLNADLFLQKNFPINIPEESARIIGSDLVCNMVAAFSCCKKACIVVDFGTALTFSVIDSSATVKGVAIAPGLKTAVNSLFSETAQLPSVVLSVPKSCLAKDSVEAIQAGVLFGYIGLVESIIARQRKELGNLTEAECPVFATGGLGHVLAEETSVFSVVDPSLTLFGLKTITDWFYENN